MNDSTFAINKSNLSEGLNSPVERGYLSDLCFQLSLQISDLL